MWNAFGNKLKATFPRFISAGWKGCTNGRTAHVEGHRPMAEFGPRKRSPFYSELQADCTGTKRLVGQDLSEVGRGHWLPVYAADPRVSVKQVVCFRSKAKAQVLFDSERLKYSQVFIHAPALSSLRL